MKILITGGAGHKGIGLLRKNIKISHGYICQIDWGKKAVERLYKYDTPENKINSNITKELTCGHIFNKELYVTSRTEVIIMDLETFEIKRKITSPTFHDLHHVMRSENDVLVANTGLEMVQRFTIEGEELEQINLSSIPTWKRFDKSIDYRLVESTKPHKIHVNFIFERYPGEIWATCLLTKKAISLSESKKCIKIEEGYIHDGCVFENSIFFTTTNGYLVEFNRKTLKINRKYNIFKQYEEHKSGKLGWCRGVGISEGRAFVGFTKIRTTNNIRYLKNLMNRKNTLPSKIIEVNLKEKRIVDEYNLPFNDSSIFSIIPIKD